MHKTMGWTYSLSFPLAIAALILLRAAYGYEWPLPSWFGLALLAVGLAQLPRDAVSTRLCIEPESEAPSSLLRCLAGGTWQLDVLEAMG
jgi:hypothetical protein